MYIHPTLSTVIASRRSSAPSCRSSASFCRNTISNRQINPHRMFTERNAYVLYVLNAPLVAVKLGIGSGRSHLRVLV